MSTQHADRSSASPGEWVTSVEGALAFLPSPLPPEVPYDEPLVNDLGAAMLLVGQLDGIVSQLPNPSLLVRPLQAREAVASSQIEGTQTDLGQLLVYQAAEQTEDAPSDVREVDNYTRALAYGVSQPPDRRLTISLVKELHFLLLDGVRAQHQRPGELRTTQVWISGQGRSIHEASFVPPPPTALVGLLEDLERYMDRPSSLPALIRLALVHYQFETIHPFNDGNGRLGRLLIPLLLVRWGLMREPALYISDYFNLHRDRYISGLAGASRDGDWRAWIDLFVRAVHAQAGDTVDRALRLLELRRTYEDRYRSSRSPATMLRLLDLLFERPAVTVPMVEQRLDVTYPTAAKWVGQLVDDQVLTEVTQRQRNRVFLATQFFNILNARPKFTEAAQNTMGT